MSLRDLPDRPAHTCVKVPHEHEEKVLMHTARPRPKTLLLIASEQNNLPLDIEHPNGKHSAQARDDQIAIAGDEIATNLQFREFGVSQTYTHLKVGE